MIYELTNYIIMNNSVARGWFIISIRTWSFSYGYARQKINDDKNTRHMLAVLMNTKMRQYNKVHIA